jgi:hypothetical protein
MILMSFGAYDTWLTTHPDDLERISFDSLLRSECRYSRRAAELLPRCAGCTNAYSRDDLHGGFCAGCMTAEGGP